MSLILNLRLSMIRNTSKATGVPTLPTESMRYSLLWGIWQEADQKENEMIQNKYEQEVTETAAREFREIIHNPEVFGTIIRSPGFKPPDLDEYRAGLCELIGGQWSIWKLHDAIYTLHLGVVNLNVRVKNHKIVSVHISRQPI